MSTGKTYTNLYSKKLIGVTELKTQGQDWVRDQTLTTTQKLYPFAGLYDFAESFTVSSNGNPSTVIIKADAVEELEGTDGFGHLLKPQNGSTDEQIGGAGFQAPAEDGYSYRVGMSYAEIPSGVETNPRTGAFHYQGFTEVSGYGWWRDHAESHAGHTHFVNPSSVVYDTSSQSFTFRFLQPLGLLDINSNLTGRKVVIWYVDSNGQPISGTHSIAVQTLTVANDGANKISTSSLFGLSTDSTSSMYAGNATTTRFRAVLLGPLIRRTTSSQGVPLANAVYSTWPTFTTGDQSGKSRGVAIIGEYSADASGVVSSSFSTDNSKVYATGGAGVIDEIIKVGPNNEDPKILVTAEAADSEVCQIEVQDHTGATVFCVDEDGDITHAGEIVGGKYSIQDGLFTLGDATSPTGRGIRHKHNSNAAGSNIGFEITVDGNDDLTIENKYAFTDAGHGDVTIKAGVQRGGIFLDAEETIELDSATTTIDVKPKSGGSFSSVLKIDENEDDFGETANVTGSGHGSGTPPNVSSNGIRIYPGLTTSGIVNQGSLTIAAGGSHGDIRLDCNANPTQDSGGTRIANTDGDIILATGTATGSVRIKTGDTPAHTEGFRVDAGTNDASIILNAGTTNGDVNLTAGNNGEIDLTTGTNGSLDINVGSGGTDIAINGGNLDGYASGIKLKATGSGEPFSTTTPSGPDAIPADLLLEAPTTDATVVVSAGGQIRLAAGGNSVNRDEDFVELHFGQIGTRRDVRAKPNGKTIIGSTIEFSITTLTGSSDLAGQSVDILHIPSGEVQNVTSTFSGGVNKATSTSLFGQSSSEASSSSLSDYVVSFQGTGLDQLNRRLALSDSNTFGSQKTSIESSVFLSSSDAKLSSNMAKINGLDTIVPYMTDLEQKDSTFAHTNASRPPRPGELQPGFPSITGLMQTVFDEQRISAHRTEKIKVISGGLLGGITGQPDHSQAYYAGSKTDGSPWYTSNSGNPASVVSVGDVFYRHQGRIFKAHSRHFIIGIDDGQDNGEQLPQPGSANQQMIFFIGVNVKSNQIETFHIGGDHSGPTNPTYYASATNSGVVFNSNTLLTEKTTTDSSQHDHEHTSESVVIPIAAIAIHNDGVHTAVGQAIDMRRLSKNTDVQIRVGSEYDHNSGRRLKHVEADFACLREAIEFAKTFLTQGEGDMTTNNAQRGQRRGAFTGGTTESSVRGTRSATITLVGRPKAIDMNEGPIYMRGTSGLCIQAPHRDPYRYIIPIDWEGSDQHQGVFEWASSYNFLSGDIFDEPDGNVTFRNLGFFLTSEKTSGAGSSTIFTRHLFKFAIGQNGAGDGLANEAQRAAAGFSTEGLVRNILIENCYQTPPANGGTADTNGLYGVPRGGYEQGFRYAPGGSPDSFGGSRAGDLFNSERSFTSIVYATSSVGGTSDLFDSSNGYLFTTDNQTHIDGLVMRGCNWFCDTFGIVADRIANSTIENNTFVMSSPAPVTFEAIIAGSGSGNTQDYDGFGGNFILAGSMGHTVIRGNHFTGTNSSRSNLGDAIFVRMCGLYVRIQDNDFHRIGRAVVRLEDSGSSGNLNVMITGNVVNGCGNSVASTGTMAENIYAFAIGGPAPDAASNNSNANLYTGVVDGGIISQNIVKLDGTPGNGAGSGNGSRKLAIFGTNCDFWIAHNNIVENVLHSNAAIAYTDTSNSNIFDGLSGLTDSSQVIGIATDGTNVRSNVQRQ